MKLRAFLRGSLAAALPALALTMPSIAQAGPADYVFTPGVTYGEHEIDFKAGRWKDPGGARLGAASIGYGYGVTQHWFTEVYAKFQQPGGGSVALDAYEWENKFQLTEHGEYPVDIGFVVELERPKDRSEGNEVRFGPLLQTEVGKFQFNGNALFERHYAATAPHPMEAGYQWQVKYRWQPALELGFQGFGELGKWNHWNDSDARGNRIGPAVFGKFDLGNRRAIRYNAAWLVGHSQATPSNNLRLQVEYEF